MLGLFRERKPRTATIATDADTIDFQVAPGDTLLNAALNANLKWPHRCKVGSCGSCKCQLVSGNVKPHIDFSYVLTADQLKEGYVLACQSELKSDVTVRVKLRNGDKHNEKS